MTAADIRQTLSVNVRKLRLERKLSQEDLAFEAGVEQSYISSLECGVRNPTVRTIARLASALNVSPDRLLC